MPDFSELIARLEKATGPNEDLEFAISQLISGGHIVKFSSAHMNYMTSIDAALTLVPVPTVAGDRGRRIELTVQEDSRTSSGTCTATVNYDHYGYGASAAISLCIAALKARSAL